MPLFAFSAIAAFGTPPDPSTLTHLDPFIRLLSLRRSHNARLWETHFRETRLRRALRETPAQLPHFGVGMLVWVRRLRGHKLSKFEASWEGPYPVTRVARSGVFVADREGLYLNCDVKRLDAP